MNKGLNLVSQKWDDAYLSGKYANEKPIPFVSDILTTLKTYNLFNGYGLYAGCGNGRNYIPLVDAGLQLAGLDISTKALGQIKSKLPKNHNQLINDNFLEYETSGLFDYLVSIQVFQHGTEEETTQYYSKTASLLKPGGLFFLRVNSTKTQIVRSHTIIDTNIYGAKTITYTDGPKQELSIHFFSKNELEHITQDLFETVMPLREVVMDRELPEMGQWVQWEGIYRKHAKDSS